MSYFLCRLVPPRADFAFTMSAAEAQTMQRHSAYWHELAEKGVAAMFGPVMDPAGPWGLGILELEDDEAVRVVTAADPAVAEGLGFRCDVYPLHPTLRAALARAA